MAVEEFRLRAESFVAFVDANAGIPRDQLVRELERQLVELYRAALDLDPPNEIRQTEPRNALTHEEAARVQSRLSVQFGDYDAYGLVFDPFHQDDPSPVVALLSDDIADIYRDLQDGLMAFRAGDLDDAVWEWWFGFDNHWADTRLIRCLHCTCSSQTSSGDIPERWAQAGPARRAG
jgi:hypothetical protein